jgi:hypothetical protein
MRRLLKPLWIFLALVFVFEAWLWSHLQPVVAWIVARIPLRAVKEWIVAQIEKLSPAATLVVFVIPPIILFPIKVAALWFLAHDQWLLAVAMLVLAKLAGVGVAAFIFDATKPKLMQMAWFAFTYGKVMLGLAWAHRLADPYIVTVREWTARIRALVKFESGGGFFRTIRAIRERVRRARSA